MNVIWPPPPTTGVKAEATEATRWIKNATTRPMKKLPAGVDEEDVDIRLACVSSKSAASRRHGHQRHHHRVLFFLLGWRNTNFLWQQLKWMRPTADILIIYEAFLCSLTERDDSGKDSATFSADIGGHLP